MPLFSDDIRNRTGKAGIPKEVLPVLILVFLTFLMDGLDGAILSTALPAAAANFNVDINTISLLPLTYLLTAAGTILIFGKFASLGHLKKLFVYGSAIFTAGLILCAVSTSLPMLIAARIFQGLGAAMVLSCSSVVCVRYIPENIRGFAFGLLTVGTFAGITAGPLLGGIITAYLPWQCIFLVNIPIGIIEFIYALVYLPKDNPSERHGFDIISPLILLASLILGVYILKKLPDTASPEFSLMMPAILFAVCTALFIALSLKIKEPFFNICVFKNKAVSATILGSLILQVAFSGMIFLLPFFITNQYHADSLLLGGLLLIEPIVTVLLASIFGRLSDLYGRRFFCILGSFLLILMYIWLAVLNPDAGLIQIVCALIFAGICFSMISGPLTGRIVDVTPKEDQEPVATVAVGCIYLNSVLGTAIFSSFFTFFTMQDGVITSFNNLAEDIFSIGFTESMIICMLFMIPALLLFIFIKEKNID